MCNSCPAVLPFPKKKRWGDIIQGYSETTRLPSVTLTDIGYYTDDGAYYYVWGGGGKYPPHDPELSPWIPMRPWPAEVGLVKVKEALYEMGVPVAYMQLDDWWYQGPFYMGNVKGVVDWHVRQNTRGCIRCILGFIIFVLVFVFVFVFGLVLYPRVCFESNLLSSIYSDSVRGQLPS